MLFFFEKNKNLKFGIEKKGKFHSLVAPVWWNEKGRIKDNNGISDLNRGKDFKRGSRAITSKFSTKGQGV